MIPRFLVLLAREENVARSLAVSIEARSGLKPHFSCGSMISFTDGPVAAIPLGDRSVILGRLYERGIKAAAVSRIEPSMAAAIIRTRGRVLSTEHWGSYVAVIREGPAIWALADPSGGLPCFRLDTDWGSALASDADLLCFAGGRTPAVDWQRLATHLLSTGLPEVSTSLDGVEEILPGTCVSIGGRLESPVMLWSPWDHVEPVEESDEAIADRLRQAITQVVASITAGHDRLLLGVSGGLDSSIVASCLASLARNTTCMTAIADGPGGDERAYARILCETLGLDLTEAWYDLADVDITHPVAPHFPSPMSRTQSLAYDALVSRTAGSQGATAFITGNGGDNVFAASRSASVIVDRFLHDGFRPRAISTVLDICRLTGCSPRQAVVMAMKVAGRSDRSYRWKPEPLFLHRDVVHAGIEPSRHAWLSAPPGTFPGKAAHIAGLLRIQSRLHINERAMGLPILNPLMAQPVLELCLRIPSWRWFVGGEDRAVARRAFTSALPPAIVHRRTKGGPDSFCTQIINRDRSAIRERLFDGLLARQNLLDLPGIERALASKAPDLGFNQSRLLTLLEAEAWASYWQCSAPGHAVAS